MVARTCPDDPVRRIVVLAAPPVEELDIVGPWEVFATANSAIRPRAAAYELHLLTTDRQRIFEGDSQLTLRAEASYRSFSHRIDTLVVPGGSGPQHLADPHVLSWLRAQARTARRVASICTGAFLLARAGLLDGRRATTHWRYTHALKSGYPDIEVEPDRIYVQDGRVYTSAGVTAGMDLAMALVEEDLGSAVALSVAQALVLFLRRPGGQAQFSALLSAETMDSERLRDLLVWIPQNLGEDLTVESLAARAAMSPRNFARVFARETGRPPGRFVEELRIEAARRFLEASSKTLKQIAADVGYSSAELMRRAFHRSLRISPVEYRDRFRRTCRGNRSKCARK